MIINQKRVSGDQVSAAVNKALSAMGVGGEPYVVAVSLSILEVRDIDQALLKGISESSLRSSSKSKSSAHQKFVKHMVQTRKDPSRPNVVWVYSIVSEAFDTVAF